MALSRTATVLLKLGEKSYRSAVAMVAKLDDGQKRKVARALIDHGFAWVVAHSLVHFGRLDEAIACDLIAAKQDLGGIVVRNLACFADARRCRILDELFRNGQQWAFLQDGPVWDGMNGDDAFDLVCNGHADLVRTHAALFGLSDEEVGPFISGIEATHCTCGTRWGQSGCTCR